MEWVDKLINYMNKIFICFSHFYWIHLRYKINGTVKIQREPGPTLDDGSLPHQVRHFVFILLTILFVFTNTR